MSISVCVVFCALFCCFGPNSNLVYLFIPINRSIQIPQFAIFSPVDSMYSDVSSIHINSMVTKYKKEQKNKQKTMYKASGSYRNAYRVFGKWTDTNIYNQNAILPGSFFIARNHAIFRMFHVSQLSVQFSLTLTLSSLRHRLHSFRFFSLSSSVSYYHFFVLSIHFISFFIFISVFGDSVAMLPTL